MPIYIFTNSPGEIVGWVIPVINRIALDCPNAIIHVFLTPCQYATGEEKNVLSQFLHIHHVYTATETLRSIIKPSQFKPGTVLLLGGGTFFAKYFAKRTHSKLIGYRETPLDDASFNHILMESPTYNLMNASVSLTKPTKINDRIALLPGSRPEHVDVALPIMIQMTTQLSTTVLLSPFIRPTHLKKIQTNYPNHTIKQLKSSTDLAEFDIALTIPGTNTMQLALLNIPYFMILPTHSAKVLRLDGFLGLLLTIPIIGYALKYSAIRVLEKKQRLYSLPNKYFNDCVCPELVGQFDINHARELFKAFFLDREKRREIQQKFKVFEPNTIVLDDIIRILIKFDGVN